MKKIKSEEIVSYFFGFLLIMILFKILKIILDSSKTQIISKKGIDALSDPQKKIEIDKAFEDAITHQNETGIWKNPELELN